MDLGQNAKDFGQNAFQLQEISVTYTAFTDSLTNVLGLLNQLFFTKLCLLFGLLIYSFKYAEILQATSANRIFVVFLKTKILTDGKI